MVTLTKYGAKYNRNILFLEGLSTDTKPTDEFDGLSVQNGSEYTEVDTGKKFLFDYDNATWYEVQTGGGGGGGGGTSNYNDLSNRPSVNNTVLTGNKTSAQLGLASSEQGGKADSAIQGVKLNSGSVITPDANNIVDITVGKADVGLSNVDNTSDLNKPISAATQAALDDKANASTTYTKTEVDTALSGKQNAIDSSHKLSADLVDDTSTTNKFATAAELEQIETNKSNISSVQAQADWNSETGVTNLFDFDTWKQGLTAMRGTVSFSENSVTLQATGNDAYTKTDTLTISVKPNTKYFLTWNTTATDEHNGTVYVFPNASAFKYTISTNERLEFTTGSGDTSITIRFGVDTSGDSITYSNIMYRPAAITATTYQPYALSNAELTTKEKQNENNISLVEQNIRKNIATINNDTNTVLLQIPVSAVANKSYQISIGSLTSDETSAEQGCRIALMNNDDVVSNIIYMARGNNKTGVLTTTGAANSLWIYASGAYQTSVGKSVTVANLMLCDKALYDAGYTDYQPYIPTVEDIMAMINQ